MDLPNPNPHLLFAEERDVIGSVIITSTVIFVLLNIFIIKSLYDDRSLFSCNAYKFMIILCIYDLVQLVVHFVTGLFTIFRSVGHPALAKLLGAIATPCYIGYVITTILLAFNRFVHLALPNVDRRVFSASAIKYWSLAALSIGVSFSIILITPYATIQYDTDRFAWFYDTSLSASAVVKQVEMVVEVGGIFVSAAIYVLIIGFLFVWFSKSSHSMSESLSVEGRILLQSFILTAYCTVLNWLWHNHNTTDLSNVSLNLMWIFNSGLNPIIYLPLNTRTNRVGVSTMMNAETQKKAVPMTAEERKKEFNETVAKITNKVVYVT
ncbi:hypothetical protein QR680_008875 [Steinernema hermaphroditum]|uniref:7TM GPCR serpentine receptor class x (Srx) domain-containing protein n=1 Tax=Steinernema hermaphroditum TaxID=289476 RepID=A0AA39IKE5_9BILA|nr:hypothetical protein QR680_008875 [Steinernema hermaphroditum]